MQRFSHFIPLLVGVLVLYFLFFLQSSNQQSSFSFSLLHCLLFVTYSQQTDRTAVHTPLCCLLERNWKFPISFAFNFNFYFNSSKSWQSDFFQMPTVCARMRKSVGVGQPAQLHTESRSRWSFVWCGVNEAFIVNPLSELWQRGN